MNHVTITMISSEVIELLRTQNYLTILSREHDSLKKAYDDLKAEYDCTVKDLQASIDDLMTIKTNQQATIKALCEENQSLQVRIEKLQMNLDSKATDHKAKIAELTKANEELQWKVADQQSTLTMRFDVIESHKQQLKAFNEVIGKRNTTIESLNKLLESKQKMNDELLEDRRLLNKLQKFVKDNNSLQIYFNSPNENHAVKLTDDIRDVIQAL